MILRLTAILHSVSILRVFHGTDLEGISRRTHNTHALWT